MKTIQTSIPEITLVSPNPERDTPFAYSWFDSDYGKETLLLMGNSETDISKPTLQQQKGILENFIKLEKEVKQFTWMVRYNDITIGAVWIELEDTNYINAPAIHIMIGDKDYRRKGIGKLVFNEAINYIVKNLRERRIYSRYLTANEPVSGMFKSLGFIYDGKSYYDENNLEWQNVKFDISNHKS